MRGGFVSLSGSDVTENGMSPFLIEDMYDARDAARLHGEGGIRGGLVEGERLNNFSSLHHSSGDGVNLFKGGVIRACGTLELML